MIRRLFVYLSVVLTLFCFITSCKKDSPTNNDDSSKTSLKKHKNDSSEDLVIRDDKINNEESTIDSVSSQGVESLPSDEDASQNDAEISASTENRIYDIAEQLPEFPGGDKALEKYLSAKVSEIIDCGELKKSMRTMVSFIVEKDGSLSSVGIAKSSGNEELDKKALSIIQMMPKWTPAQNDGEIVRMKYIVPVLFKANRNR